MKKGLNAYVPFLHENFEFKIKVIELARKQPVTFEGIHTATLIYVNAVDYVAQHILSHINHINYLVTNNELNSVVFFDYSKTKGLPLGKTVRELERYEFPDKKDFLKYLAEFTEVRNRIVHNLLSLTPEEINKLNDDFGKIKEIGELLITKGDTIARGISGAWTLYVNKLKNPLVQQNDKNEPITSTEKESKKRAKANNSINKKQK